MYKYEVCGYGYVCDFIYNEARPKERSDRGHFSHLCRSKTPLLHNRVHTGCHYLISLSVLLSVCLCNIRRFFRLREPYEADFHKRGIYGSRRVWTNAWDVYRRVPSRGGRGHRDAVDFVVCLGGAGFIFKFVDLEHSASTR